MDGMASMAVTRHEMTRRREQLQDLQRYLAVLEADHDGLRAKLLGFRLRYLDALGPLMRELDELEAQLHQATGLLSEALKRQGVDVPVPALPRAKAWPDVPALPEATPLPPEPTGPTMDLPPPTLKTLYRRAAKRFHPDLAPPGPDREVCEQRMMAVNEAYEGGERSKLESLLLAAGELLGLLQRDPEDRARGDASEAKRIDALVQQRIEARRAKDFAAADQIRKTLAAEGIEIMDGPDGSTWRRV